MNVTRGLCVGLVVVVLGSAEALAYQGLVSASPGPRHVWVFEGPRQQAVVLPLLRGDIMTVDWSGSDSRSVRQLVEYVHDPVQFPSRRGIVIHVVGDVESGDRVAIAEGTRDVGAAVLVEDPLDVAADAGPAEVAWYAGPEHRTSAEFWATLMHRIHGTRYVALGDLQDYEALERRGAIVPSVVSFGGSFPIAAERSGWAVDGRNVERGGANPGRPRAHDRGPARHR